MQNIFKFIRSMNFKGLSLSVENGFLKVTPRSLLTDNIRAKVKKHKAEIIDALLAAVAGRSCWGNLREV